MKLKNKKRLLNELVKESESPKDFIQNVMALQNQTAFDVVRGVEMTSRHFYVIMSCLAHGKTIGIATCVKIAQGLDIDPQILYKVVSEYAMNKYLNK